MSPRSSCVPRPLFLGGYIALFHMATNTNTVCGRSFPRFADAGSFYHSLPSGHVQLPMQPGRYMVGVYTYRSPLPVVVAAQTELVGEGAQVGDLDGAGGDEASSTVGGVGSTNSSVSATEVVPAPLCLQKDGNDWGLPYDSEAAWPCLVGPDLD